MTNTWKTGDSLHDLHYLCTIIYHLEGHKYNLFELWTIPNQGWSQLLRYYEEDKMVSQKLRQEISLRGP